MGKNKQKKRLPIASKPDVVKREPILTGKEAYIARLRAGETVSFREKGNSMTPKIKSNQKCTYSPVLKPEDVKVGDIVFCKVGPWRFTHIITAIDGYRYQISNNHGHVNGWTSIEHIYGKVIEIGD